MNISRIERIKNILCKEYGDNNFLIKDNSKEHKGHSGFDGKNETHIRNIFHRSENNYRRKRWKKESLY